MVQRDEAWLAAATPEQIAEATQAGELWTLMGVEVNELGNRPADLGRGIRRV